VARCVWWVLQVACAVLDGRVVTAHGKRGRSTYDDDDCTVHQSENSADAPVVVQGMKTTKTILQVSLHPRRIAAHLT